LEGRIAQTKKAEQLEKRQDKHHYSDHYHYPRRPRLVTSIRAILFLLTSNSLTNHFHRLRVCLDKKPEDFLAFLHFACRLMAFRASGLYGEAYRQARTFGLLTNAAGLANSAIGTSSFTPSWKDSRI